MVTNFRHERLIKEKRQNIYGAFFLIFIIIILGRGPIFSFIGRLSHFVGIPVWKIENSVKDSIEFSTELAKPKSVVVSELLELRNRASSYENKEAIITALKIENRDIKEAQGRRVDGKLVLARVLSRPPVQIYDTLIIDVGSANGVTLLSKVYTKNDYVIGMVTRVYGNTSVVTLMSTPGEVHQVMVPNFEETSDPEASTSERSLLHDISFTGMGGGGFRAQIPRHLSIATNTPMVLSSIDTDVIGIVTGESIGDSGSLKDVYGSLPSSINSIDWVTVKIKETE